MSNYHMRAGWFPSSQSSQSSPSFAMPCHPLSRACPQNTNTSTSTPPPPRSFASDVQPSALFVELEDPAASAAAAAAAADGAGRRSGGPAGDERPRSAAVGGFWFGLDTRHVEDAPGLAVIKRHPGGLEPSKRRPLQSQLQVRRRARESAKNRTYCCFQLLVPPPASTLRSSSAVLDDDDRSWCRVLFRSSCPSRAATPLRRKRRGRRAAEEARQRRRWRRSGQFLRCCRPTPHTCSRRRFVPTPPREVETTRLVVHPTVPRARISANACFRAQTQTRSCAGALKTQTPVYLSQSWDHCENVCSVSESQRCFPQRCRC